MKGTGRNTSATSRPAPSWRTIGQMDQARLQRTARRHAAALPTHLARLADEPVSHTDAAALMQWCSDHRLPLARAGRRR